MRESIHPSDRRNPRASYAGTTLLAPAPRGTLRADARGSVDFRTAVLAETPWAMEWTAQGDGASAPELLRVCGWCNRVDVHGEWAELEVALAKLHLVEYPEARMITHGIREPCMVKVTEGVDALAP